MVQSGPLVVGGFKQSNCAIPMFVEGYNTTEGKKLTPVSFGTYVYALNGEILGFSLFPFSANSIC